MTGLSRSPTNVHSLSAAPSPPAQDQVSTPAQELVTATSVAEGKRSRAASSSEDEMTSRSRQKKLPRVDQLPSRRNSFVAEELRSALQRSASQHVDPDSQPAQFEDALPAQPSRFPSSEKPSSRQTRGVNAQLNSAQNVPKEIIDIARAILKGFDGRFPSGFNNIDLSVVIDDDDDDSSLKFRATSETWSNGKAVLTLGVPSYVNWSRDKKWKGEVGEWIAHEIARHILPDQIAHSLNLPPDDEASQHIAMLSPPNEDNEFHREMKRAVHQLSPELRSYFLDSYADDLENQRMRYAVLDTQEARDWINTIYEKADSPESPFWNV